MMPMAKAIAIDGRSTVFYEKRRFIFKCILFIQIKILIFMIVL